jgi:hypothetical protein
MHSLCDVYAHDVCTLRRRADHVRMCAAAALVVLLPVCPAALRRQRSYTPVGQPVLRPGVTGFEYFIRCGTVDDPMYQHSSRGDVYRSVHLVGATLLDNRRETHCCAYRRAICTPLAHGNSDCFSTTALLHRLCACGQMPPLARHSHTQIERLLMPAQRT